MFEHTLIDQDQKEFEKAKAEAAKPEIAVPKWRQWLAKAVLALSAIAAIATVIYVWG